MSVVVKGMEMPESCAKCKLKYWTNANPYCPVIKSNLEWNQYSSGEWTGIDTRCPLVELPDKHGRLIDADRLIDAAMRSYSPLLAGDILKRLIDFEPTVVEAEGD